VEQKNPGIVAEKIQALSAEMGLGKKNIITGCIDTPKLTDVHDGLNLVITTPLRCRYSDLDLDAADAKTYYLHNSLFATEPDIRVAVEKIGVRSIKVIAQNSGENALVAKFVEYLKADSYLSKVGVTISDPVMSTNRTGMVNILDQKSQKPSNRPRMTL
jgi:hypothetical protein